MEKARQQKFEGKIFRFLFGFGNGAVYGCDNTRLITNSDGSVYGTYQTDRKGVNLIF